MTRASLTPAALALLPLVQAGEGAAFAASDGPRFRRPQGLGVAADEAQYPGELDLEGGLLWSAPVAAGHSPPIVVGQRIFVGQPIVAAGVVKQVDFDELFVWRAPYVADLPDL